jgi:hypothetical protein
MEVHKSAKVRTDEISSWNRSAEAEAENRGHSLVEGRRSSVQHR